MNSWSTEQLLFIENQLRVQIFQTRKVMKGYQVQAWYRPAKIRLTNKSLHFNGTLGRSNTLNKHTDYNRITGVQVKLTLGGRSQWMIASSKDQNDWHHSAGHRALFFPEKTAWGEVHWTSSLWNSPTWEYLKKYFRHRSEKSSGKSVRYGCTVAMTRTHCRPDRMQGIFSWFHDLSDACFSIKYSTGWSWRYLVING